MGQFKKPDFAVFPGAGKRPLFISEQFRLHQLTGNGRAVDHHERLVLAGAVPVDFLGQHAFARAGLTVNMNRIVIVGNVADLLENLQHLGVASDDIGKARQITGLHHEAQFIGDIPEEGQHAHELGEAVGLGLRKSLTCPIEIDLMPPGKVAVPAHWHLREDEVFFVLSRRQLEEFEESFLLCAELGIRARVAMALPHLRTRMAMEDLEGVPRGNPSFISGRFFTIFNTEILYPLTRAIQLLTFLDMGDTWNDMGQANLANLRKGAGFGIRVEVPMMGTIGFDYGYGFDRVGGPSWEPHFNIGSFF